MKKVLIILVTVIVLLYGLYFFGSGFNVRDDVHLIDYAVSPTGEDMTILVGVFSSAGYTRTWKNVSDDPAIMELEFYSAFGGINGSIGAENRFVLPLDEECTEIRFKSRGNFYTLSRVMLMKDPASGQWEYVQ